jgi:hypothetical protein
MLFLRYPSHPQDLDNFVREWLFPRDSWRLLGLWLGAHALTNHLEPWVLRTSMVKGIEFGSWDLSCSTQPVCLHRASGTTRERAGMSRLSGEPGPILLSWKGRGYMSLCQEKGSPVLTLGLLQGPGWWPWLHTIRSPSFQPPAWVAKQISECLGLSM